MNVYFGYEDCPTLQHVVLSIGKFSGFHPQHDSQLKRLWLLSQNERASSMVVTFEPLPIVDLGEKGFDIRGRMNRFKAYGVDHLLILPFFEYYNYAKGHLDILDAVKTKVQVDKLILRDDQEELTQLILHRQGLGLREPQIERVSVETFMTNER